MRHDRLHPERHRFGSTTWLRAAVLAVGRRRVGGHGVREAQGVRGRLPEVMKNVVLLNLWPCSLAELLLQEAVYFLVVVVVEGRRGG